MRCSHLWKEINRCSLNIFGDEEITQYCEFCNKIRVLNTDKKVFAYFKEESE